MVHGSKHSEAANEQAASALVGCRVVKVRYWGLPYSGEWDFGDRHWPIMGIEVTQGDDSVTSMVGEMPLRTSTWKWSLGVWKRLGLSVGTQCGRSRTTALGTVVSQPGHAIGYRS